MTKRLSPDEQAELRRLIQVSLDERATVEDSARLQEWVCRDEEAGRLYVQYMQLHARLHWNTARQLESEPSEEAVAVGGAARPPSPVLGSLGEAFRAGGDFLSRSFVMTLLLAIGLPSIVFVLLVVDIGRQTVEPAPAPLAVAEIMRSEDTRWEMGGAVLPPGTKLVANQSLHLREGLVEIAFAGGADVILQGPIEFCVVDGGAGFLREGSLVAHVPMAARGFVIGTPVAKVVDLGTEFGLDVRDDSTEIHVFEGVVEATQVSQGVDEAARSPLRLEQGTAASVDRQKATVLEHAADPSRFARKMPHAGVTDRLVIHNPSFEFPPIDSSSYAADFFKIESGNAWNLPIVGWERRQVVGVERQPAGYQLSPYKLPDVGGREVGPGATDGRQVALLCLRKKGSKNGTIHENWIFQPLGEVTRNDVGKTLELRVDVCAREGEHDRLGDGARAMACFAKGVTVDRPGTVVGSAGVVRKVLCADGIQTLTATLTIGEELVGERLFIRLSVANENPRSNTEQYHFDDVRCRVTEE